MGLCVEDGVACVIPFSFCTNGLIYLILLRKHYLNQNIVVNLKYLLTAYTFSIHTKGEIDMQSAKNTSSSLPSQSSWGLSTDIGGRSVVRGVLDIHSVSGRTVTGTANFRGMPVPIQGIWDENTKQLSFETPFASFSGQLQIFDSAPIGVRHLVLSGRFVMKTPSPQAGEHGNWIATTNKEHTGPPIKNGALPPVGVFLTSNLLHQSTGQFYRIG